MDEVRAPITPFPERRATAWIDTYREEMLTAKDEATIETYTRILEKFAAWLSLRPGNSGQFSPQAMTRTAIESFLDTRPSLSYKKQARAALCGFCRWLQEDQHLLSRNPVRGVAIPAQALLAPRELSEDRHYVIRDLVEREADVRSKAAFAPGYWAGCRVSDVSWLLLDQTRVSRKAGWMTVGHKGGKERTIDRGRMRHGVRCMITSNRVSVRRAPTSLPESRAKKRLSAEEIDGWRWPEDGIHQWWLQRNREGVPRRSQIHQRHRFPRSPSRFCASSAGSRLEPGRGGVLPGHITQSAGCQPFKPRSATRK